MALSLPNRRSPRAPDATVIYAVGDLHGRLDLLEGALGEIRAGARAAEQGRMKSVAVFLGDYIDRGPDSARVLNALIALRSAGNIRSVFLRGNHEQVLLDLLDGSETTARWIEYGGRETLQSYGVKPPPANCRVDVLQDLVRQVIPPEHIEFLRATQMYVELGDYLFVHAGLRPDRLLEEQSDADLLWFRYYDDEAPVWAHTVVHGHSTNARPVVGRWRIGVDTEAYASSALTVLRLEAGQQDLLKITPGAEGGPAIAAPWDQADPSYRRAARARPAAQAPRPRSPPQTRKPAASKASPRLTVLAIAGVALVAVAAAAVLIGQHAVANNATRATSRTAPMAQANLGMAAVLSDRRPLAQPDAGFRESQPVAAAAIEAEADPEIRVQIAAAPDAASGANAWNSISRRFPEASQGKSITLEPVQSGGRVLQRVLVTGFEDQKAARAFCQLLRDGDADCLLRQAPAGQPSPPAR